MRTDAHLLVDFGSTFTKVTAVSSDFTEILGTAQSPTTVETDIAEGLRQATDRLEASAGSLHILTTRACSSAAGGLRIVVSGLVEALTSEAAKRAALGAGGKVLRVFSRKMTLADGREIEAIQPDVFLLTGGTDGGDEDCILANAARLAKLNLRCPILIAGNRQAADECCAILEAGGKVCKICPNVMPQLGQLNIQPIQEEIRSLFLARIIQAKGVTKMQEVISDILMPTPVSVLKALTLLSQGTRSEAGIGPLMAVDLGGATCDVYSIDSGSPRAANTILKGLPEPFAKRTVEGDIGMRISIHGIIEAAGMERIAEIAGLPIAEAEACAAILAQHPETLPDTDALRKLDQALASMALEIATVRHAGTLEEVYTPMGMTYVQEGKDLHAITQLLFIGGTLIRGGDPQAAAEFCKYSSRIPASLRPQNFQLLLDKNYIISAIGLLADEFPNEALHLMKKEIAHAGSE